MDRWSRVAGSTPLLVRHRQRLQAQIWFEVKLFGLLCLYTTVQNYHIYSAGLQHCDFSLLFLTLLFFSRRGVVTWLDSLLCEHHTSSTFLCVLIALFICLNGSFLIFLQYFRQPPLKFLLLFLPSVFSWLVFGGLPPYSTRIGAAPGKPSRLAQYLDVYPSRTISTISVVFWQSAEYACWAGLYPLVFVTQHHLYYDVERCLLLTAYVFCTSLVMLLMDILRTSFNKVL